LPFRDNSTHLHDILEAIDYVESFLSGMDFSAYTEDVKTKSAVERQMQIITEAAVRLGQEAETLVPGPDWTGFRGMGNILRHAYHRIDDQLIWNAATDELPTMKGAILKYLQSADLGR
jgi:uncharacterized protein with HEPN domain